MFFRYRSSACREQQTHGGVSALFDSAARRVRGHEEETEAISRHHFVSPPPPPCRAETLCASVGGRNVSESQQKVHQSASSVATIKYPAFLLVGRPSRRPRESCIFARGATRLQGEKQGVRTHTEGQRSLLKSHTVKEHFVEMSEVTVGKTPKFFTT